MDLLGSPRATYAAASAVFTASQIVVLFAAPACVTRILEPGLDASGAGVFSLRAVAFAFAPLAFNQARIATGKLTKESTAHFYTWFLSITLQILVFALSYIRYIEPRPYDARLSFSGSLGWGGLLVTAGGLATSGIWCVLFTDEGGGGPNERSRSSSWLFPTQEKRKEKAERREKRYKSGLKVK